MQRGATRATDRPNALALWPGHDVDIVLLLAPCAYGPTHACTSVVMPSFGDANDAKALEVVAALHPDRRVVQVPAREVLLGGGCIHCITQQQVALPAAAAADAE